MMCCWWREREEENNENVETLPKKFSKYGAEVLVDLVKERLENHVYTQSLREFFCRCPEAGL